MRNQTALELTELDQETASLLPAREMLCTIGCVNITTVVGVNLAIAVNAATINSSANAIANQYIGSWQQW